MSFTALALLFALGIKTGYFQGQVSNEPCPECAREGSVSSPAGDGGYVPDYIEAPWMDNCDNRNDDDGDLLTDRDDPDCWEIENIYVGNCGNGIDDDGDGFIDGADPDCLTAQ